LISCFRFAYPDYVTLSDAERRRIEEEERLRVEVRVRAEVDARQRLRRETARRWSAPWRQAGVAVVLLLRAYWTGVLRMFRKAYFFWWMPGQWVTASVVMMRLIFIQVVVPWLLLVALSPLIVLAVAYAFFAGLL